MNTVVRFVSRWRQALILGLATPVMAVSTLARADVIEIGGNGYSLVVGGPAASPGLILTHEDGFWRFSARSVRSGDVVHR
jgi:hypothetical protein